MTKTIMLIHGAWLNSKSWEGFKVHYEAQGYKVVTPDWPLDNRTPAELRNAPDKALAKVGQKQIIDHFEHEIRKLDEAPILIGHSLGGLVAQLAAGKAPIRALVLLAPSPPWGVASSSMEEAVTAFGLHMLGPFWMQAVSPDRGLMRTYSLNRMDKADREAAVERLRTESGRALWETLNWWLDPFMTTGLGAGPLAVPSLVLVGARDVVHPPATARLTAERLGAACREFPEMSHWLPGEPGWDQVANATLAWLDEVAARA